MLAIADERLPYEVICDACGYRIGNVLLQRGRPIAYYSYKMTSAERNYPIGEQELLGVVKSLEHWRCYLEGCVGRFTVLTDHKPKTFLNSKPSALLSRRQVRWQACLARFVLECESRKCAYNIADPLSKHPALMSLCMTDLARPSEELLAAVRQSYAKDPWFQDQNNLVHVTMQGGLYRNQNGQILVPCDENARNVSAS